MGKPTEEFKALAERYGMRGHHFHADRRGFIIVTRAGFVNNYTTMLPCAF